MGSDDRVAKSIMLLADHFVMDLETQLFWVVVTHFIRLKWGGMIHQGVIVSLNDQFADHEQDLL